MSGMFLLQHGADNFSNIFIALVDDDGFRIVVQFIFAVFDVPFQMGYRFRIQLESRRSFFIPFKNLDGVPAEEPVFHLRCNGLFNMGNGMFHAAGEYGRKADFPLFLCCGHRLFGSFHAALSLECRDFHHFTSQFFTHFLHIDGIPVLFDEIHHIDRHHHRKADFDELGRKVKVSFQVRAIDDIQDGIGLFIDQVIPGHLFFQCIGGKGINPRKVLDDDIGMLL